MCTFDSFTDKLDFLKKYKLLPKSKTELSPFYYFAPNTDIPVTCEVIGYEKAFDNWAVIVIQTDSHIINIHSSYLLEMKERGNAFYKNASEIVFDIETTGFSYPQNEIIEIAAIKYTGDDEIEFHEYVKIDSIIPIDITLLTGISNDTIKDADPIDIVMPKFLSFIGDHTLIGHNITSFDIPFINKVCTDLGLPTVKNKLVDTLYIAREKLPELESHKLLALCEYFEIDTANAHHALFDCYMCRSVYTFLSSNESGDIITAANPFQKNLLSIIKSIISEKELPEDSLRLRSNKSHGSYSVMIHESSYPLGAYTSSEISTLLVTEKYKIDIALRTFNNVPCPENVTIKMPKSKAATNAHVTISFPVDNPDFYAYINHIVLYRLEHYSTKQPSFSCCDKFTKCSDAKKCVHENKLYSTACTYRRNLENGRIFYGKNRNVD